VCLLVVFFALKSAGALHLGLSSQVLPKADPLDAVWLRGAMAVCSTRCAEEAVCMLAAHLAIAVSGVP
jgi:hypothetical protein